MLARGLAGVCRPIALLLPGALFGACEPPPAASESNPALPTAGPTPKPSAGAPEPRSFAPTLADRAWEADAPREVLVVNTASGSISSVDLRTMTTRRTVDVGPDPYGIAVTHDAQTVAIGVEGEGKVVFRSLPDLAPKGELKIGGMHHDHLVLSPDGKHVLVANYDSDSVIGVDVETMKEAFRIRGTSAPHVAKYGPLHKHAYVTCKKVTGIAIIDPEARSLVKFHPLNVNPRSLTFSEDETKLYFASFWVDGFFEMETESGRVTRLLALEPPEDDNAPREVTYHGVEAVGAGIVLAANEGRSYLDAVDVGSGRLLDRLTGLSKPCCVESVPGREGGPVHALVSNIGDGTIELVALSPAGELASVAEVEVGGAPKRLAFVPIQPGSDVPEPRSGR